MRFERWAARFIFVLGAPVLVATSPAPTWEDARHFSQTIESHGRGDAKLIHITLMVSAPVARDLFEIQVGLTGHANRPASDVRFRWLIDGAPVAPISGPELPDAGLMATQAGDAGGLAGLLDAGSTTLLNDAGALATDSLPSVQPTDYADGFLSLYSGIELRSKFHCAADLPCEVTVDALLETQSDTPYSLELHADVNLRGVHEKQPKGGFEVSMEVLDAP